MTRSTPSASGPAPERFVTARGATLCTQAFGEPDDPPIVLIHGACASMLWWQQAFCERLAAAGRYVIRFDNRDTGRSTMSPPGAPDYALSDLAADVVAILDDYGLRRAHVVGRSMSGATALALGVDYPDRIGSLTFVATTPGDEDLPPMTAEFTQALPEAPDLASPESVIEHIVGVLRAYAGRSPLFDEAATRALAAQDVARTPNMASTMANHYEIEFDAPRGGGFAQVTAPCLVVHGGLDPVYPPPHGVALARHLRAGLLELPLAGHDLPEPTWPVVVDRLVQHTAAAEALADTGHSGG